MMDIETLLFTSLHSRDLFDWQERAIAAHPGKEVARVDTWEIHNHPDGNGGTFTLYACAMVLVDIERIDGDMRRQYSAIHAGG